MNDCFHRAFLQWSWVKLTFTVSGLQYAFDVPQLPTPYLDMSLFSISNLGMGEKFEIEVGMLAPSVNSYWKVAKWGGRYITPKGIAFKKLVMATVGRKELGWSKPLKLSIELHSPSWWTKKGTISKTAGDVDNYCKSSLDSLFACFDLDDSQVFELSIKKVVGNKDRTVYVLEETT